ACDPDVVGSIRGHAVPDNCGADVTDLRPGAAIPVDEKAAVLSEPDRPGVVTRNGCDIPESRPRGTRCGHATPPAPVPVHNERLLIEMSTNRADRPSAVSGGRGECVESPPPDDGPGNAPARLARRSTVRSRRGHGKRATCHCGARDRRNEQAATRHHS